MIAIIKVSYSEGVTCRKIMVAGRSKTVDQRGKKVPGKEGKTS
jgi:hypothetical protein